MTDRYWGSYTTGSIVTMTAHVNISVQAAPLSVGISVLPVTITSGIVVLVAAPVVIGITVPAPTVSWERYEWLEGEPVKTHILKTLEAMLAEVVNVGSVHRWEDIPFDLSTLVEADFPVLFFWEEEEKEEYNRLSKNTLDFLDAGFFSTGSG